MVKITLEETRKKLLDLVKAAHGDNALMLSAISSFIQWINDNQANFDDNSHTTIDKITDELPNILESEILQYVPEGEQKENLARILNLAKNPHYVASGLAKTLSKPSESKDEIVQQSNPVFVEILQIFLDILIVIVGQKHQRDETIKITLFHCCIDELLAAFHLAQHGFSNQSFSHVRTITEILDLIMLFNKNPKEIEVWTGPDSKKIWNELGPSKVRRKLDFIKDGPEQLFYEKLSELGPHATFGIFRSRSLMKVNDNDSISINVSIAGTQQRHQLVWAHYFVISTLVRGTMLLIDSFKHKMNMDAATKKAESSALIWRNFTRDHFIKWAKDSGIDTKDQDDFLNEENWKFRDN